MGYNNENAARLVFDIETCALESAKDYIAAPNLDECRAPSTWKDPIKIAEEVDRKRAAVIAEHDAQLTRCALDWNLSRIVAIGWWSESDPEPRAIVIVDEDEQQEREALETFWAIAKGRRLVGFAARSFDVPTLIQRSRYLGVHAPDISLGRYGRGDVTDLRGVLTFDDARYEAIMPRSLTAFCKRFGIEVDDPLTGADIAQAVAEERWADVERHVMADVHKTALLAAKLGCYDRVTAGAF